MVQYTFQMGYVGIKWKTTLHHPSFKIIMLYKTE